MGSLAVAVAHPPGGDPLHEVAGPSLYHYEFSAMGTVGSLFLYAHQEQQAGHAAQLAMDEVARIEQRYSRHREESELSRINRVAARGGSLDVDEETGALLDYALACYIRSGGLFDITSGTLRKVWGLGRSEPPEAADVDTSLRRVGWWMMNWQPPNLSFLYSGMELDLGGIVKEYAVDRAVAVLREAGIQHALVDLGGDLAVTAPCPDGSPWLVGIADPRHPDRLLARVALSHGGLATSGDYERCFEKDGRRYGHILDPLTGWPARGLTSVSVVADRCLVAGTLSTIAMLMGSEGASWLEGFGLPCLWVKEGGELGRMAFPFFQEEAHF